MNDDALIHGRYPVLRCLGSGGFGEVPLAQDGVLGIRQVAINFLTQDKVSHHALFLDEMRAVADLKHPGVVSLFHHFNAQTKLALVMDYREVNKGPRSS